MTRLREQPGDVLDDRRLPGAANAKIADADDRASELPAAIRMMRVPLPAPAGGGAVDRAERVRHLS